MNPFIAFLFAAFLTFSSPARAFDHHGRFGVGLGVGPTFSIGPSYLQDLTGPGIYAQGWVNYHVCSSIALELGYDRLEFDGSDIDANIYALSVRYRFNPSAERGWFAQLGAGLGQLQDYGRGEENARQFATKAAIGYEADVGEHWTVSWRVGYTGLQRVQNGPREAHVVYGGFGLTYTFGSGATKAVAAEIEKSVTDGDADQDGVSDSKDRCPGTPTGAKANAYGCAEDEKLSITINVQFTPGSSVVSNQYRGELEKIANFMKEYPETNAEIAGHTDNTGKESSNKAISQKRAESVANYLTQEFGITSSRLKAVGYGPQQPIADNSTAAGRQRNRRVVADIQAIKKGQ